MIVTIDLPEGSEILIKNHQTVDFNTPVAIKKSESNTSIPLAKILGIKSADIFLFLKKTIGEKVARGELIAEKKKMVSKKSYYSNFDGQLKEIDHIGGNVIIAVKSGDEVPIKSHVKGSVVSVRKDRIEIELPEGRNFPVKDITQSFGGETVIIHTELLSTVNEGLISNKIVFVEKVQVFDQVKIETLDAKGLVTLYQLPQDTKLPNTKIKNPQDWKKIIELKLPYCIIDKKNSTIYFYK